MKKYIQLVFLLIFLAHIHSGCLFIRENRALNILKKLEKDDYSALYGLNAEYRDNRTIGFSYYKFLKDSALVQYWCEGLYDSIPDDEIISFYTIYKEVNFISTINDSLAMEMKHLTDLFLQTGAKSMISNVECPGVFVLRYGKNSDIIFKFIPENSTCMINYGEYVHASKNWFYVFSNTKPRF